MSEMFTTQYMLNKYTCPECDHSWADIWECAVEDTCPACGQKHIEPWWNEELNLDKDSPEHNP